MVGYHFYPFIFEKYHEFFDFHLQVAGRLAEFRDLVKEVVRSACRTALLEAGFTPDDYFMDMDSPMGMYAGMFVIIAPTIIESWYLIKN